MPLPRGNFISLPLTGLRLSTSIIGEGTQQTCSADNRTVLVVTTGEVRHVAVVYRAPLVTVVCDAVPGIGEIGG